MVTPLLASAEVFHTKSMVFVFVMKLFTGDTSVTTAGGDASVVVKTKLKELVLPVESYPNR
ncbi:hypothetical protein ES703_93551 [subsurface metagenome]